MQVKYTSPLQLFRESGRVFGSGASISLEVLHHNVYCLQGRLLQQSPRGQPGNAPLEEMKQHKVYLLILWLLLLQDHAELKMPFQSLRLEELTAHQLLLYCTLSEVIFSPRYSVHLMGSGK